jgi:hypothetical protein
LFTLADDPELLTELKRVLVVCVSLRLFRRIIIFRRRDNDDDDDNNAAANADDNADATIIAY